MPGRFQFFKSISDTKKPQLCYLFKVLKIWELDMMSFPHAIRNSPAFSMVILLMEEIMHQLIDYLSHNFRGFIHPRDCRFFSINSIHHLFHLYLGSLDKKPTRAPVIPWSRGSVLDGTREKPTTQNHDCRKER